MPNMFGGDQLHPAYRSRKLEQNEVLIEERLYTIQDDGSVLFEDLNGKSGVCWESDIPAKVRKKMALLKKKEKGLKKSRDKSKPQKKVIDRPGKTKGR